jgi:hypothetical protein
MKYFLLLGMLSLAAGVLAQEVVKADVGGDSALQSMSGPDVLSLEDTAKSFFTEIAIVLKDSSVDQTQLSAKEILKNRDGLSDAEADEVIAVASHLNTPEALEAERQTSEASLKKICSDLRTADTPEEMITVLSGSQARSLAKARLAGGNLLSELRPSTRAHVMKVLTEHRKGITVARIDWSKASPQKLNEYKNRRCSNAG